MIEVMDLTSAQKVSWSPKNVAFAEVNHVMFGPNDSGLGAFEVVVGKASKAPSREILSAVHSERLNKRTADVAVALEFGEQVWIFGPDTGRAPITLSTKTAERQLQAALNEPNSLAAYRRLTGMQQATAATDMPGVQNTGLFANYHLRENVTKASDWTNWNHQALQFLTLRHRDLVGALGFEVAPGPSDSLLLTVPGDSTRAVALLLEQEEAFDSVSQRFQRSPVAVGLSVASNAVVPWLILLKGDQIRLYPAKVNVGVGQKGQIETYFELDLATLSEDHVGFLPLIFSAGSLASGGMVEQLLADSAKFASALGVRLRERVYGEVVPALATEVAQQLRHSGRELNSEALDFAYRTTLTVLFRLLFQAYAEDRGLLPAGRNEAYDANSLKTLGARLLRKPDQQFGEASAMWRDLKQVWNSIDKGNPSFEIPPYNGGLFATDEARHLEGAYIERLEIPDTVMGPALRAMLIDASDDGVPGLVDFRSLSVREFGTIYEGLLESSLSLAEQDLTLDKKGVWVPAGDDDQVLVPAGEPYFHNSSGERKATGSYFTPAFIVDHLIERTIDPTLDRHLERIRLLIKDGETKQAARDFFDYRVADLAMGSGHFLVAAVDRIEAKMRDFLAEPDNYLPDVQAELLRLAEAAKEALGRDEVAFQDIEQATLLRRQVARRCVYGIDINVLAVELSRLALWIHTFVPGLPMSTLDHNLVCANSLTGIGTVDEAKRVLDFDATRGSEVALFGSVVDESLERARDILIDIANATEATKAEVAAVKRRLEEALVAAEPTRKIFDAAVAVRTGLVKGKGSTSEADLIEIAERSDVQDLIAKARPAHMPYLFPEVFLRDNEGFDALIGNPPWEKAKVETSRWWAARFPGLRSLPQGQQDDRVRELREIYPGFAREIDLETEANQAVRKLLMTGPYPGIGKGDPDLYQAFAWRNYHLIRDEGRFGIVAPRSLVSEAGSDKWREKIYDSGVFEDVALFENTKRWLFDMEPRYSIIALTVRKTSGDDKQVTLRGPYNNLASYKLEIERDEKVVFPAEDFRNWGTGGSFLIFDSPTMGETYMVMRRWPRLGQLKGALQVRPHRELDASNDKPLMDLHDMVPSQTRIPIYKGESFDLWNPDTGTYYGTVSKVQIEEHLQQKRQRGGRLAKSVFSEFPQSVNTDPMQAPHKRPRIAYRWVTNRTNTRTLIVSLVPPGLVLQNGAPYLLFPFGGPTEEAYMLGVLSSIPLDWAARRVTEVNMTFTILNSLPIPDSGKPEIRERVVDVAGRLAAVDERYSGWAKEVGVPVGSVKTAEEKNELTYELDALVSLLYGFSKDQVIHIFETFHRGWRYEPRLERVLNFYEHWKDKA